MKSEFLDDKQAEESSTLYSAKKNEKFQVKGQTEVEDEEIEFVFIQENPMQRILDKDRPRGSIMGIFPMRTVWDKTWYGTGIAYLTGKLLFIHLY